MTYISSKTYGHELGLSVCFRQHKASSHCRYLHGYALSIRLEFEAAELNECNWVIDFGGLKDFKQSLQRYFDHRMLVAEDDPAMPHFMELNRLDLAAVRVVPATGCEAFAKLVFDMGNDWLHDHDFISRVHMRSVEVCEHGANSAIYFGEANAAAGLSRGLNLQQSESGRVASGSHEVAA